MNNQCNSPTGFKQLPLSQKVFLVIYAAMAVLPAVIVDIRDLPPASWLKSEESRILGGYYLPKLTGMILILGNALIVSIFLILLQIPVKLITGKKLGQLLGGKRPVTSDDGLEK